MLGFSCSRFYLVLVQFAVVVCTLRNVLAGGLNPGLLDGNCSVIPIHHGGTFIYLFRLVLGVFFSLKLPHFTLISHVSIL